MAALNGYTNRAQMLTTANPGIGIGGPSPSATMDAARGLNVVDGTPARVIVLALAAAAGLTALRFAGFRFNVGVSASS